MIVSAKPFGPNDISLVVNIQTACNNEYLVFLQAYQPSEAIKPGDMLSKRESVKEFSAKELPIDAPTTVRQMLEQYQVPTLTLKGYCDIRLDN